MDELAENLKMLRHLWNSLHQILWLGTWRS